jgi:hypothetical protein
MNLTIVTSRSVFETAMTKASELGRPGKITGTASFADAIQTYLKEAWDRIDEALTMAYRYGRDRAKDLLDAAIVKTEELLERAGSHARDLHAALLERLRLFLRDLIEGSMSLVPDAYQVGEKTFKLTSMKCTQKVMVSGSLKYSLSEVFALVSSGEIAVEAEYALGDKK